ncbi:MAG: phenylalanine--tRNA ligase subunit alpha [Neisseriaceae bacterium]
MDLAQVASLVKLAIEEFEKARSVAELDLAKSRYLGKEGSLNNLLKQLGGLATEDRKRIGSVVNTHKKHLQEAYLRQKNQIEQGLLDAQLKMEAIDVTLAGRGLKPQGLHPIRLIQQRMVTLFRSMGFDLVEGPEIEEDYYCFEALNIPQNHPARAMHDTFYVENGQLLRPHTSSIQIRHMLAHGQPPVKIIAPGRTYRVDSDATHSPMFHQLEGLWVEEDVSFLDLKSVLTQFLQNFFEKKDLLIRFRPSFFPFTEPSAEIDIKWEDGWLEVGGCGMVHPKVLQNVRIDSERYTGFAFGLGIERYAMLYYGVPDLRLFFENEVNFLKQFN